MQVNLRIFLGVFIKMNKVYWSLLWKRWLELVEHKGLNMSNHSVSTAICKRYRYWMKYKLENL